MPKWLLKLGALVGGGLIAGGQAVPGLPGVLMTMAGAALGGGSLYAHPNRLQAKTITSQNQIIGRMMEKEGHTPNERPMPRVK